VPAVTYLSDAKAREWATVPDDKDCDELLQQLNRVSGRKWVIGRHTVELAHAGLFKRMFCKPPAPHIEWTLYLDCHGEWQVMNLVTPDGGSNFHPSTGSREAIMNYMLGYIGGARRP